MEHLSYEDYNQFGGKCDINDFPLFLLDCESKLQSITDGRIDSIELDAKAKRLIVLIIDDILEPKNSFNNGISSFSDGIDSITYNTEYYTENAVNKRILALCKQYLGDNILYRGVVR